MENSISRLMRDEEASLSVELVLILPLLIWGFLSIYTIFDVFKARNLALKGNYAVSDLLSRETASIDSDYLNGALDVFRYLTQGDTDTWLRVSEVFCNAECDDEAARELVLVWSRATGEQEEFVQADVDTRLNAQIPLLALGARAILVETSVDYVPPFIPPTIVIPGANPGGWGILRRNTFYDFVVTEPRFGPQLCWSGVDGC